LNSEISFYKLNTLLDYVSKYLLKSNIRHLVT